MSTFNTSSYPFSKNSGTDGIRSYLVEIGRIPLLSQEQEITYGKQVQQMMQLYEKRAALSQQLGREPSRDEWATQVGLRPSELESVLGAGQRAKHKMMEANLRLVVSIAKKYVRQGVEFLDLIQEGTLGMERGIEKFDPAQGYKLSTYIYWWIRQGITRSIAQQGRTIRLPSHVCERLAKIKQAQRQLSQQLGRSATPHEIAQALELETTAVRETLLLARHPLSVDLRLGENEDTELGEMLQDERSSPEDYMLSEALHRDIAQLLAELPPRQREVLVLRFGLDNNRTHSLQEIGEHLGVSRERVRQIEARALKALRHRKDTVREYLLS